MNKMNLDSVAPEAIQGHTSKGDQPKWHIQDKWYKADHMGYEALAEVIVSQLLQHSNVLEFVAYEPILIQYKEKERPGCISTSFQKEGEMLISFERLHRAYKGKGLADVLGHMIEPKEKIRYTVEFVEQVTGLIKVGEYLTLLLELDLFFLNEDRHTNNMAVIRDEKTKRFRLCPVFDNGLALLADINDYPLDKDMYDCIDSVQAKPFNRDFEVQVEAAEELYGMQLKFSFTRHEVGKLVRQLKELYAEDILDRVERVIYEQMRKYRIYF